MGRRGKVDTAAEAKWWGVSRRRVQQWAKEGYPIGSRAQMARTILALPHKFSGDLRPRAEKIMQELAGGPVRPPAPQPENRENDAVAKPTTSESEGADPDSYLEPQDHGGALKRNVRKVDIDIYDIVAYWQDRRDRALIKKKHGDPDGDHELGLADEKLVKLNKELRDQEMHERRMGRELGESIGRDDLETILRAMVFALLRGIDQDIRTLSPKLINVPFREEVDAVLDRFFIKTRVVEPMAAMVGAASELAIPQWVADLVQSAVVEFCENES